MKITKTVALPIITGRDYSEPGVPRLAKRNSRAAARKALCDAGHRIMHVGGLHDMKLTTKGELREWRGDDARVREAMRELVSRIPGDDDTEVVLHCITVHP